MSLNYGDQPTPPRRLNTVLPPSTPRCRCGEEARMYKEGSGYTVACSDPFCPVEELPLAHCEACPTKGAALHYWQYKRTGRL